MDERKGDCSQHQPESPLTPPPSTDFTSPAFSWQIWFRVQRAIYPDTTAPSPSFSLLLADVGGQLIKPCNPLNPNYTFCLV